MTDRRGSRHKEIDRRKHDDSRTGSHVITRDHVPKATLYVTGFMKGTSARRLAELFEQYGPLAQVSVLPPRRSDGEQYAFVAFRRIADMENVLDDINQGKILDDGLAIDIIKGIDCQRAKRLPVSRRPRFTRDNPGGNDPRSPPREDRRSRGPRDYRDRDPRDYRDRDSRNYRREQREDS